MSVAASGGGRESLSVSRDQQSVIRGYAFTSTMPPWRHSRSSSSVSATPAAHPWPRPSPEVLGTDGVVGVFGRHHAVRPDHHFDGRDPRRRWATTRRPRLRRVWMMSIWRISTSSSRSWDPPVSAICPPSLGAQLESWPIRDPYGEDDEVYLAVARELERRIRGLLVDQADSGTPLRLGRHTRCGARKSVKSRQRSVV